MNYALEVVALRPHAIREPFFGTRGRRSKDTPLKGVRPTTSAPAPAPARRRCRRGSPPRTSACAPRNSKTLARKSKFLSRQAHPRSCGGARAGDRPGGRTRGAWSRRRRPRECRRRRRRSSRPGPTARRASSASRAWSNCGSRSRCGRSSRARRRRTSSASPLVRHSAQCNRGARRGRAAAAVHRGRRDSGAGTRAPQHADNRRKLVYSLVRIGECAETAVLLRTTLAAQTRTLGADDVDTLATGGFLINALHSPGEHA